MRSLVMAALASLFGAGLVATVWSFMGVALFPGFGERFRRLYQRTQYASLWVTGSVLAAVLVWALTAWPSAGLWVLGAGLSIPLLRKAGPSADFEIARVEAIATWTEQIRDTLAASAGLQQAMIVTARRPPMAIEAELARFASRAGRDLSGALRQFGRDVAHPAADLVVAGLLAAVEMDAGRIGELLTRLAAATRSEASMRVRIEVGRARIRTSMKIVGVAIAATVVLLLVFGNGLLSAYDSLAGQIWLTVIGLVLVVAVGLSRELAHIPQPERFVSRERVQGVS